MSTVLIPLTQGQFTIIDAADERIVSAYAWHARHNENGWYAGRYAPDDPTGVIWLHRFLLNAPGGVLCDHRDGNGLNNVRSNLRLANHQQNQANKRKSPGKSSRFKGVSFRKNRQVWVANIKVDNVPIYLGYFKSEVDAAIAYNVAALKHFGEFALLNPIDADGNETGQSIELVGRLQKISSVKPLPVPIDDPAEPAACYIDIGRGYRARIDRIDAEAVCYYRWYANVHPSVVYVINGQKTSLQTFLMQPAPGMMATHRTKDRLDNRRSNLTVVIDKYHGV